MGIFPEESMIVLSAYDGLTRQELISHINLLSSKVDTLEAGFDDLRRVKPIGYVRQGMGLMVEADTKECVTQVVLVGSPVYAQQVLPMLVAPEGKALVDAEPTEKEIDAPRGFLLGLELGHKNLESMRKHMKNCGEDISMWPEWAKTDTGHITKAGKALIIRSMMFSVYKE